MLLACREVFASLDRLEQILSKQRYVAGDRITEVRLLPLHGLMLLCSLRPGPACNCITLEAQSCCIFGHEDGLRTMIAGFQVPSYYWEIIPMPISTGGQLLLSSEACLAPPLCQNQWQEIQSP